MMQPLLTLICLVTSLALAGMAAWEHNGNALAGWVSASAWIFAYFFKEVKALLNK